MDSLKSANSKTFSYYLKNNVVFAVFSVILLLLNGCASHKNYKPHPELIGYSESGEASYYAMKFQFRKTASGERFNNYALTAAHKTLPF